MTGWRIGGNRRRASCAALLFAPVLFMAAPAEPAGAGQDGVISAEEITRSLTVPTSPEMKTRGFQTRGIRREDSEDGAAAAGPPKIDIRILFETDSDRIDATASPQLAQVARALRTDALADSRILIEGHTDSVGPAAYNMELSNRRAASVKRYLVGLGVPAARLETVGRGEAEPIADNDTVEGRALNRRVTLINLSAPSS